MFQIKEQDFFELDDKVSEMTFKNFATYAYTPTIADMEKLHIKEHIEEHLPYLLFISHDPFEESNDDTDKVVKYANDLLKNEVEIIYD